MSFLDAMFEKFGLLRRSEIERIEKEKELDNLRGKVKEQEESINYYNKEMQNSIDLATIDLRESLEQFEIQNVELSIAKRKYHDLNVKKKELEQIVETVSNTEGTEYILREISFSPEYRQAGVSILSYFSRIVELKYPDVHVKVKIEQFQEKIRLIIETPSGEKEIIEKLLSDYGEVINGKDSSEPLFRNDVVALELKSELRIANVRIENQKELLSYQNNQILDLKELFGTSLTNPKNNVQHITLAPSFQNNNQVINVEQVNKCKSEIFDLLDLAAKNYQGSSIEELGRLKNLKDSIDVEVDSHDKNEIKNSSWLKKLKEFAIDANDKASDANDIFKSLSDGFDKAKKIAIKYNAIAQWCGAPQIPTQLIE